MPKNINQKGFSPLIVVLALFGLLAATGLIFFLSSNKSSTQTFTEPIVAGDETTDGSSLPNFSDVGVSVYPRYPSRRFDVRVYWRALPNPARTVSIQLKVAGKVYNKAGTTNCEPEYGCVGSVDFENILLPRIPVTLTAFVDSTNSVRESLENDNKKAFVYEGDVDLRWVAPTATIDDRRQITFTGGIKNFGRANAVFDDKAPIAGLYGVAASVKDKDSSGTYFYRKSMPLYSNYFTNWPANNTLAPGETLNFSFTVNHLRLNRNDTVELMVNDCTRLNTENSEDNFHFSECTPLQIVENVGLFNNTVNITIQ